MKTNSEMRDRLFFAAAQPSQSADDIKLFELMIKLYRPSTMMKPDAYMLQRYYKICESIRQQVINVTEASAHQILMTL